MLVIATVSSAVICDPLDGIPVAIWRLLAAGWLPGPPESISDEFLHIDQHTATCMPCNNCGRRGGRYHAVHRTLPPQYRAFSCCRHCGSTTEV
jgi:hypothetical protein